MSHAIWSTMAIAEIDDYFVGGFIFLNSASGLLGPKALIWDVLSFLHEGFKRAFVNQPGLTQLHARQPAFSE